MKFSVFTVLVMTLIAASGATAQSTGDSEPEDPFKNDPFFSKPFQEFFQPREVRETEVQNRLNQLNEEGVDYGDFLSAGPYNSSGLYSSFPNLPMIHYNRVSGLYLGLENERMQWFGDDWLLNIPQVRTHGLIGYSFGQKEWNYGIGLEKLFGRKRYMMIGGEYYNGMTTDDHWRVGLSETSLTSFFAGYDFLDYYKQQGYGLYLITRSRRLFEGGVSFNDQRFSSLSTATDWALFGSGGRYRQNPAVEYLAGTAVDTLNISSLTVSASFNPKRLVIARHFTLSVNALAEIADPGIGDSDYGYNKYIGEITAFLNFEPGGVFKYRLRLGAITGEAPNMKEFQLGGIGSLRALPYKSLSGSLEGNDHYGNQMVLSNAEMQFGSPVSSNSDWIDFDNFYLSLFLDSGWVGYSAELSRSNSPFTDLLSFNTADLKHNAGIGLGSSLLRFELAWDLNDTERAPVLWVRLNPTF